VVVVLLFATVFWGLWYLSHCGFSQKWRQAVITELEKRGVYMTVQRLTLDPLQGLVAQDVKLRTSRERGFVVATVNEVVLDINYSNLVHGEPFLNAIELHNATVSLPLDSSSTSRKSNQLEISRLNARVLLPPHQLTIEWAEAFVRGLRITASGHWVNPEKLQWPKNSFDTNPESPMSQVKKALDTLNSLQLNGGHPSLELRFRGDLANLSSLYVEATLRSGSFSLGETGRIESIQIAATLADGLVRVDQCEVKDSHGTLDATGTLRIAIGEANWLLRSTLDLPGLIHAALPGSALHELVLYEPPLLEMNGSADFHNSSSPTLNLYGHLAIGRFMVKSLLFEEAGTDFSWKGTGFSKDHAQWYLHNAHIRHKDGEFLLNAMQTPGDFRFNLDNRINPTALLPLLPTEAGARLAEWEFLTPPLLHLEGRGPSTDPSAVEVTGRAQLGATRARGTALNSATLDLGFKGNVLTCQNIKLERPEGTGAGAVAYDFSTDELRFLNVRTTLNPVEVVRIFDRDLAEQLLPYRFKTRPALVVNGKVGCAHDSWDFNRLRVEVDGARGMDYTFIKKDLSSNKISGVVSVIGDRLKLDNLDASIFGGRLRGKADISLRKAQGDYTAELATEEIDFPSLTKLYFDFDTSKGKLNGSFAFSGLHDFARAISGKGQLTVTDGNVFAIPIFGPFSGILNGVLPGLGYNEAHKGTCTFEMHDGVVSTQDLVMEGKGFSIYGDGKLYIVEDRMDFTARLNAHGLPGTLLSPMSHLLEYVSDGSLSKPVWRPKLLPKAIFGPRSQPIPAVSPNASPSPFPSPSAMLQRSGTRSVFPPLGGDWREPGRSRRRVPARGLFASRQATRFP